MIIMQKAVTPQMSETYLTAGYDRVAGFVVRAADVVEASTPASLFEAHGLGFPGSPFSAGMDYVDVLRFPLTPQLRLEDAIGGIDEQTRRLTGGPFVDRPPFTGSGFAAYTGAVVPLYWLVHSRIPAGAQLVRIRRDGKQQVRAQYVDVAHGWQSRQAEIGLSPDPQISRFVGPLAQWRGTYFNADVRNDDAVVLAAASQPVPELGFAETSTGRWRREVPRSEVTELFEMSMTGRWNGLEMRVVDRWDGGERGIITRISYTGHNADLAEGLQLPKVDAGVYEANVLMSELDDLTPAQLVPAAWA